jgi:hypothetical protein
MILVKAAAGLVIEFGRGEAGKFDALSVRLSGGGAAARMFRFQVSEGADGRLVAHPLDEHTPADHEAALRAVEENESLILAEVRKYRWVK